MKPTRIPFILLLSVLSACAMREETPRVQILEDRTSSMDIERVASSPNWESTSADITKGYSASTFWFRITRDMTGRGAHANAMHPAKRSLVVESAMGNLIPRMELYFRSRSGDWIHRYGGYEVPPEEKGYISPFGIFPLPSEIEGPAYLMIRSPEPVELSIRINASTDLNRLESHSMAVVFIWIGVALFSFIASIFLYVSFRDRMYLSYAIYLLPLAAIYVGGYLFAYDFVSTQYAGLYLWLKRGFPFLTASIYLDMLRRFFELPSQNRRRDHLYFAAQMLLLAGALLSLLVDNPEWNAWQLGLCYATLALFALAGVFLTPTGRRASPYFLVFWLIEVAKVTNRSLALFGEDSVRVFSIYGSPLGLFLEMGLIATRVYFTLRPRRMVFENRTLHHGEPFKSIDGDYSHSSSYEAFVSPVTVPSSIPSPDAISPDMAAGSQMSQTRAGTDRAIKINHPGDLYERMERLIQEKRVHLDESLTLAGFAKMLEVKPYILSDYFRAEIQTNFRDFINTLRIQEAKKLLIETEMNVTRIAYECGFNSRSAFYNHFKKLVGVLPQEYRSQPIGECIHVDIDPDLTDLSPRN